MMTGSIGIKGQYPSFEQFQKLFYSLAQGFSATPLWQNGHPEQHLCHGDAGDKKRRRLLGIQPCKDGAIGLTAKGLLNTLVSRTIIQTSWVRPAFDRAPARSRVHLRRQYQGDALWPPVHPRSTSVMAG
jgi:hypothetical protein